MPKRIIGIDTGGTMAKAAVFELDGREVGSDRRANQVLFPEPGHTEIDAEGLWRAACGAIRGALEASRTSPDDIVAVSTTGHGNGLYAVDAAGLPVAPGIISTDSRAGPLGEEWMRQGHGDAAEAAIMQRFWPGQTLALLGWFKRHRPDALERAAALFGSKDYLRGRLTGELSTEITEAAVSGLADLNTNDYAHALFDRFGFAEVVAKLPPILPSLEVGGTVTAKAAGETGLRAGTPVVRGLTDVVACAVASGVTSPDQMAVIAGTFSVNETLHAAPRRSFAPMLQMPYPIGGLFIASECSATSASNLEWICRTLLRAEAERAVARGSSVYEVCGELVREALGRPATDILFMPFLFGGPAGAPAGLLGMTAAHDLADVLRAVFEGIAFAHRLDIERLRRGSDAARPKVGRLAGGAARSTVWPQIFADVLALPIEVTAAHELGAQGAAISAATALGHYPTIEAAVAAMVTVTRRYEPDPGRVAVYEGKFARFAAVANGLAGLGVVGPPADANARP